MKKIIFASLLLGFSFSGVMGQNRTFKFFLKNPGGYPQMPCNPLDTYKNTPLFEETDKWMVSHGTPQLFSRDYHLGFRQNKDFDRILLVGNGLSSPSRSEGIFINYNFIADVEYQVFITFALNRNSSLSSSSHWLRVALTNNLLVHKSTINCGEDILPFNETHKDISSALFLSVEKKTHLYDWEYPEEIKKSTKFMSAKDLNQLWVFVRPPGQGIYSAFEIIEIEIIEKGPKPPSIPLNLKAFNNSAFEHENRASVDLYWDAPSVITNRISHYEIYANEKLIGTSPYPGVYYLDNLTLCTNYTLSVRAIDSEGIASRMATVYMRTVDGNIPSQINNNTNYNDVINKKDLKLTASESIILRPGFHFVAKTPKWTNSFHAKIVNPNCSPFPRAMAYNPSDIIEQEDITFLISDEKSIENRINNHSVDIQIYPNPVKDYLTIQSNGYTITSVEIVNIQGHILHRSAMPENKTLSFVAYPSGIYTLRLYDKNHCVKQFKVVKNTNY